MKQGKKNIKICSQGHLKWLLVSGPVKTDNTFDTVSQI